MIKIECTADEQKDLFRVFDYSDSCLFEKKHAIQCKSSESDCHNCYNENVEWVIIQEDVNSKEEDK